MEAEGARAVSAESPELVASRVSPELVGQQVAPAVLVVSRVPVEYPE